MHNTLQDRSQRLRTITICFALSAVAPLAAHAESNYVNTSTQQSTGFSNGSIAPFTVCTTQSPNLVAVVSGRAKVYWTSVLYKGTRMERGAEFCSSLVTHTDGWMGFNLTLPDKGNSSTYPSYPDTKEAALAQVFQRGYCNSWAAMLRMRNNNLYMVHRASCGKPTEALVAKDVTRGVSHPIVIHTRASHRKAGVVEVWYDGGKVYGAYNIDFGFGSWSGNALATGNGQGFKFGQYAYDADNYESSERRTVYYDNVSVLVGNAAAAYERVRPDK